MNRKTFIIVGIVAIFVIALLAYLFLTKSDVDTSIDSTPRECLIFQSDDPQKPCYQISSVPVSPNKPIDKPYTPTYPTGAATSSSTVTIPDVCSVSGNTFERNNCITKTAVSSKNSTFCTLVVGSLAQNACVREVESPTTLVAPVVNQSYESFIRSSISGNSGIISPLVTTTSNTGANTFSEVSIKGDPRLTEEAFNERFKNDAPLALFGVSAYQVRPGDAMTLSGTGFLDKNEIHFDGTILSGNSSDGFTIATNAPGQMGVYEVWVTNTKGSSRSLERPMRITVTDNPAPLPLVSSISPAIPSVTDVVIVTGSGFSTSNTISTSLGPLLGVSSNGSSMQFKMSDFPITPLIKDLKEIKGKKIPVQMYVQSDGGITKEVFSFEVQF